MCAPQFNLCSVYLTVFSHVKLILPLKNRFHFSESHDRITGDKIAILLETSTQLDIIYNAPIFYRQCRSLKEGNLQDMLQVCCCLSAWITFFIPEQRQDAQAESQYH